MVYQNNMREAVDGLLSTLAGIEVAGGDPVVPLYRIDAKPAVIARLRARGLAEHLTDEHGRPCMALTDAGLELGVLIGRHQPPKPAQQFRWRRWFAEYIFPGDL